MTIEKRNQQMFLHKFPKSRKKTKSLENILQIFIKIIQVDHLPTSNFLMGKSNEKKENGDFSLYSYIYIFCTYVSRILHPLTALIL